LVGSKGAKTFIIENSYDRNRITGSRYTTLAPKKKPVMRTKKFEYNREGKLVREIEESATRYYEYDSRGRLVKEEYKSGDSSSIFYYYKYEFNGPDSIINISVIEKNEGKTDSTFLKQIYNSRGNLILESRKVSPTYYKTFPPFCTTGDEYTNRYQYDEKGRKIIDGSFVREGTDYYHKWVLESREQTTILKTYLSKKSELLLYIDQMDGPGGNEKTFFDYSK
jgi:YD repeat-containing protein